MALHKVMDCPFLCFYRNSTILYSKHYLRVGYLLAVSTKYVWFSLAVIP